MRRMTAGFVLFLLTLSSAPSLLGAASGPAVPDDVRQHVRELVDGGYAVGMVIGVIDPNGTSFFCHGKLSAKGDRKVDPDAIFEIGSITKVFTSLLLADLAEHKLVGLDDPVEKYLPPTVKVPARGDKKITLRHLASHTSGLPRMPSNFEPKDPNNPYADYDAARLYAFLSGCKLERDIGSRYEYSNLGAGLLGHTLSRAAGEPYEQLIVNRICRPLGMNDTAITLSDDLRKRLAQGHGPDGKPAQNWDLNVVQGAGGLRSSARDMLKFLAAAIGLCQTPLKQVMELTCRERHPTGNEGQFVALGWHINTKHDTEIIWHNGGTGGYRSFCGFVPGRKFGVVVLSNTGGDGGQTDPIALHVLEPKYPLPPIKKPQAVDAGTLEQYVGYYELAPGAVFSVRRRADQLLVRLTGQDEYPVYAKSKNQFFYKVVEAQLTFTRDDRGKVNGLVLFQSGIHQPARRLGPEYKPPEPKREVPVDAKVLQAYVGKYKNFMGHVFDVTAPDGKLMVQVTGQPRLQVFPESDTEFFYKEIDARITFVKEKNGSVSRLILHQGNMNITAKRIE
jgi:D-alanyl-D-alanine-carboxypeptidase/D-alanyl-D-alanine-endopeptidase